MRIAHFGVYKVDSANGVNKVLANLARAQSRIGHDIYIYSLDLNEDKIFKEKRDGINIVHFKRLGKTRFMFSSKFKEYIEKNNDSIDIFHLHSVYMPENIMLSRIINKPYVVTPHGGYALESKYRNISSFIKKNIFNLFCERKYLNNASAIHALTAHEVEQIELLTNNKNIFIQANGISTDSLKIIDNFKINLLDYGNYFVFCGRLDVKCKGIDLLVKAYNHAYKNGWLDDFILLIVGPGKGNKIERMISQYGLEKYIILTGPLYGKDKMEILKNCKFFVQCSRWEGFPMSVLEAIGLKKPVVITRQTNIGDLIEEYDSGIVVEPKACDIAEALKQMCILSRNSDYIEHVENSSSSLANNEFSWDVIANNICNKYINVTKAEDYNV